MAVRPDKAVALLNDAFRGCLGMTTAVPGRTVMTCGIAALPIEDQAAVLRAVATFRAFTPDNDPWQEHDYARLTAAGHTVIWKIDYYENAAMEYGAEDKRRCYRLLTVMLAEEY